MRRTCALGICTVVLLFVAPTRAHAWWEFIESLSGPGRWTGPDVDARLVCFVDTTSRPELRVATGVLEEARKQTPTDQSVRSATTTQARLALLAQWRTAVPRWQLALETWERLAGARAYRVSITTQAALDSRVRLQNALEAVDNALPAFEKVRQTPGVSVQALQQAEAALNKVVEPAFAEAQRAIRASEVAISGLRHEARVGLMVAFAAPGFILSACRLGEDERRRAAIDLSMRFVWTKDERFVPDGEKVYLTTIEPAFSWSLFDDPNHDFVDYGIGAGFYWIASERFPTVSGGFLEPIRLDFHAPTNSPKALRAIVVRTGLLVFPGGFSPDAFPLLSGVPNTRISRDAVKYIGFYLDTDYLFKKKRAS